jgi:hypothetical protein
MKPALPLRIAAVLAFIHAVLHTIGGVFGKTSPGPAAMVVATMKANPIQVLGVTRTLWDFYHGMGLGVTIALTAESIIFWQLATLAKTIAPRLRPILATFLVAYLALAVNSYRYFFAGPVIAEIFIAACFAWAIVAAKPAVTT